MTCWRTSRRALSKRSFGRQDTTASIHAAGGSTCSAMLAGLPMPIRLPGLQSQVHPHIRIYVTPNEVVLTPLRQRDDNPVARAGVLAARSDQAADAELLFDVWHATSRARCG